MQDDKDLLRAACEAVGHVVGSNPHRDLLPSIYSLRDQLTEAVTEMGRLRERAEAAEAKVQRLNDENTRLRESIDVSYMAGMADGRARGQTEVKRLTAENERVREDAERYRYLRGLPDSYDTSEMDYPNAHGATELRVYFWSKSSTLDAAVDAAMAAQPGGEQ